MQPKKMTRSKLVDLLCWDHGDQYIDELRSIASELQIIAKPDDYEHLNFEQLDSEFDLVADNGFQVKALEFFAEQGL